MIRALLLTVVIIASACTERVRLGNPPGAPIDGLVALEVTPVQTALAIDDLAAPPQTVTYTALGQFDDGTTRDVSGLVAWTTDNPAPGSLDAAGGYVTSNEAGGHVAIVARSGDIAGTAALTVVVSLTLVDSIFPPPAGAAMLFAPGTPVVADDPMRSPEILYPSHETMFPQGLARILFQFARGMTNDAFRISFESDVLHLTVLTGSDRWQPDDVIWALIGRSHPGAAVTLGLDAAASSAPGTIYSTAPAPLRFAREPAGGVVYYFSDTTNGVMRGSLGSSSASPLFPEAGDNQCAGCHAVSRDGNTMALGYGDEKLATLDIATLELGVTPAANIPMGWAAFAPDNQSVLVADKGTLTLRDLATGAPIGPANGIVPLPPQTHAAHPDWAPDGTSIVVTLASSIGNNIDMKGGSIARISYMQGTWGAPEILVTSTSDNDNNFFPRWSPDGTLVAYVHANSPSRDAKSAELRLVSPTGGAPIPLRIANHRVGRIDDVPDLAVTMPSWAPGSGNPGNTAWLAFSSTRPYGAVRPARGDSQIWIAGIDLLRTEGDPSFAAFWLPCQDITALANNPIWTVAPTGPTR